MGLDCFYLVGEETKNRRVETCPSPVLAKFYHAQELSGYLAKLQVLNQEVWVGRSAFLTSSLALLIGLGQTTLKGTRIQTRVTTPKQEPGETQAPSTEMYGFLEELNPFA